MSAFEFQELFSSYKISITNVFGIENPTVQGFQGVVGLDVQAVKAAIAEVKANLNHRSGRASLRRGVALAVERGWHSTQLKRRVATQIVARRRHALHSRDIRSEQKTGDFEQC